MRERILAEIKRLAATNGGKPPGQNVFSKETIFRSHDWGKYWARWSDAVKDAGLTSQEWNPKKDITFYYPLFADSIRRYTRFPTDRELDLFRNTHPQIPANNTLRNHFGSKAGLVDAIRKWAAVTDDYKDIVELLPEALEPESVPLKSEKEGHVYLIKSGAFYKIGRGDELEKRIKQIRTALPDASILEHSIRTDDPSGIEAYWHRRFAEKRANGEWFKLTNSDVAAFRKRKYQ
jgi:Meiotically up-regulated gene 113